MSEQFSTEQRAVIQAFETGFAEKRDKNIILYGVGINTRAILDGTAGFSIIGLMDVASEGQMKYGLPVYSADDVSRMQVKPVIAIIARQSVVQIIYKRIAWLYEQSGIEIYDFQGKLLGAGVSQYSNEDLPYWNHDEEELKRAIDAHDVVTFDIFDTLLMRRVLEPPDVFEMAERKLRAAGMDIPFKQIRMDAERELARQGVYPDIHDIYDEIGRMICTEQTAYAADSVLEKMKKLELELDRSLLLVRGRMLDIFRYAVERNKIVYLLSDMYYPASYLEQLLAGFGICGCKGIWVSCDQKCEKADGTMYRRFAKYLAQNGVLADDSCENRHRILHIGDNRYADYEKAVGAGYDAFLVYSAYELLQASSLQRILASANTLEKKAVLGVIISRVFNDPFVLGQSYGWFRVDDERELGYCFLAPVLLEFAKWFAGIADDIHADKILFPSRDGYLIQKIYKRLAGEAALPSVYFRTSRRAVTVAGIYTADDIRRIAARTYQGTCGGFLKARFGIDMRRSDGRMNTNLRDLNEQEPRWLLEEYESEILARAASEREQYLRYLDSLGISSADRMLIFDFVAGGTVQYAMEQLLHTTLRGAYFATMNLPNSMYEARTDRIQAAFGNIASYKADTNLGQHYLLMETVLVDDKNTFSHIDADLNEVYEQSAERTYVSDIMNLQQGVLEYVDDYLAYFGELGIDLTFADEIYGLLWDGCQVSESVKKIFENDDYYDGQETSGVFG